MQIPISVSPEVLGSTPVFASTRVLVQTLLDYLEAATQARAVPQRPNNPFSICFSGSSSGPSSLRVCHCRRQGQPMSC